MALYFFHGDDKYLLGKRVKALTNHYQNVNEKSEGFDIADLRTLPMFGTQLSVWNVDAKSLNNVKDGKGKSVASPTALTVLEALEYTDTVDLAIVCSPSPDGKLKVAKALLKADKIVECKALAPWDTKGAVSLTKALAKEQELTISPKVINRIVDSYSTDSGKIDSELSKLKSVYGNKVTDEQAIALLTPDDASNVFDFCDAVLDLDLKRSLEILLGLDEPTQKVVAILTGKAYSVYSVSMGLSAPVSSNQASFWKRKYTRSKRYLELLIALKELSPYPTRREIEVMLYSVLGER